MAAAIEDKPIYRKVINVLAIVVPITVAFLLGIRQKVELGAWTKSLPHVIGVINSLTAICLLVGYYYIRQRRYDAHRKAMTLAFLFGSVFLVCYILYHVSNESTPYGGTGLMRPIYFFLLISHIVLSIVVVWFVLRAIYFGFANQLAEHRKTVKWAWPIWLYVSVSGVIVYLMISPYYT
ncbi:putative membrane protein [Dyadobacter jejuensis]|uniref:Putative membrane protein n=1 Tax=Dyadobacter jejuensis TaxID=1082580 RepID=A0A316AR08_9BACT|nr:DUF420 domain-containing protein [Dyadobacter jejuensis]PWJ60165.1 putative membrane protein [Dyadobacter jejuensis]